MEKYLNKVMIVDGSYVLHRSLHTPGLQELQTSSGMKTGGVFGALRILQSEIKKFPGYFPIFCFDKGLSQRRVDLYPEYKANRQRQEADTLIAAGVQEEEDNYLEEYHRQRTDLILILRSLGIPSLLLPGWEGDDLQYLLSTVCEDGVVISDDKDMIQLLSPTITIRRSMRDETITWDANDTFYHHNRFTIRKAITGDGSDNIMQVAAGVGETTADKIAQLLENVEFDKYKETLEAEIQKGNKLSKKLQSIIDNWDHFLVNYQLIDLNLVEAPVGFEQMIKDLITIVVGHSNILKAYQLIGQYEMKSIFPDQIIGSLAAASAQLLKK